MEPRAARCRRSLRVILDAVQDADGGDATLDTRLAEVLAMARDADAADAAGHLAPPRTGRWTSDVNDALALLSESHNFSLGRRDGVCWAWIQPNDGWEPPDLHARHDHPYGSGLVVANTPALALVSASVNLLLRRFDNADWAAEPMRELADSPPSPP